MSIRSYSDALTDFIGFMLFPRLHQAVRRRNAQFLVVSLLIGLVFCLGFGAILLVLNYQGRI